MNIRQLVQEELMNVLKEQDDVANISPFSDEEKAFLGKFAISKSRHLGIIYSKSDIGIEEFISRSGPSLNLNSGILIKLIKDGVIEIVPYGGMGRNEDYTLHLKLQLSDVADYAQDAGDDAAGGDDMAADAGGDVGAEPADAGAEPAGELPVPEPGASPSETILKYGDILVESAKTAKKLIEQRNTLSRKQQSKVYSKKSRVLNRLPSGYIYYLERIITILGGKLHNDMEKEHLVADILDNLAHNFGLTPGQILKSYTYYRYQNRLQQILKK